ncbi:MAG TPA: hypothetical protein VHD61_03875 [Lacunisphaera sp.]|nr:hypothetical protein [Lacunisphaera sp.]
MIAAVLILAALSLLIATDPAGRSSPALPISVPAHRRPPVPSRRNRSMPPPPA